MGFLSGSLTFERYWITKDPTDELGPDHLQILEKFKIGKTSTSALDEPRVGFLAGAHLLDTRFSLEKNVLGDALHFAVRIDSDQIPSAIRNAWLQMELAALTADNPSGKPTKAQRQEARESVEARCADEANSGKFRRMQQLSVLWDAQEAVVYLGGTSPSANELCLSLLERAFGIELDHVSSGKLATAYATAGETLNELYKVNPTAFTGEGVAGVTWWNGMADNYDYLGNEFLLWLWWHLETKADVIRLADDSDVSGMFARTLTLDCPLGESGKETISAESPVALPEAALAIRSGKQPRKAGLTLVRNGEQYDFALQAESFSVGSAKITKLGSDANDESVEDRIARVRRLAETLDLLFEAFCEQRIGKLWRAESKRIKGWLEDEPRRASRKPAA